LRIEVRAARRRVDLEVKRDMFIAWHTAVFHRMKKIPALAWVLKQLDPESRSRVQSTAEQLGMARMLTALFGGEDRTSPDG
jgi:hypothetical protein